MENERISRKTHNIIMENRKTLSVSGVNDLGNFDDETVVLYTELGLLTIKGTGLHIGRLSVETGDISITGEITLMAYSDAANKKASGVLSRLFK